MDKVRGPALAVLASALLIATPFVKMEEGLGDGRGNLVYIDPVGVRTWCYGQTGPVPNTPLNEAVCSAKLDTSIREHCEPVARRIRVPVYDYELAAICSWAYNVGTPRALSSTLLSKLNSGDYAATHDQFLRWHYAQGRDCKVRSNNCYGVWQRRLREASLFLGVY